MNKRRFKININGKEFVVDVEELPRADTVELLSEDDKRPIPHAQNIVQQPVFTEIKPAQVPTISHESKEQGVITAPMPGVIVSVTKKVGENVIAGEPILVLEAMKMENEIRAPIGGTLLEIKVSPSQRVDKGETLVVIE